MFLIENHCSDTTDIDELNSRDLRKRMKYRIKLLSDLRQRFRKEYLSELIQKQNDNRVREPRIGEMVLIGNDNKKRLSWPIAKIIELIPGRDGEIRTVRLKTQHGTLIRPMQRIFPLEVQAIANSDKELKEESISVKSTTPEKVLNTNDAIVKKYTSSGRLVKELKRLDLLNYNCFRFETLPKSQRGEINVASFNHKPSCIMGKKLKGGRRQILQLEEKKPPNVPSKSKVKYLKHHNDIDDHTKKSNESDPSSLPAVKKDITPLESQIADFFKWSGASHLSSPSDNLTRGLATQRIFRVPACDTIHLQTSMPSPGFESRPYGTVISIHQPLNWMGIT
ncbi:DUF5641 domain-containing protein [Trichonephila clavipes]|nr:DUF5641 domain-containing protein [Trichonephila clavipes]